MKKPTADGRSIHERSLDVVQEISQLDKHLSDDGSLFKSSNIEKLTNQVADLQHELDSKNKLLSEKDTVITSLIECGILKDRELNDLRNRICSIERNSCTTCNDSMVSDLMMYFLDYYNTIRYCMNFLRPELILLC